MGLAVAIGIALGFTFLILGICAYVLVCLPSDYLERLGAQAPVRPGRIRRLLGILLRNVIGLLLLVLGLVLVIPGVPGPGILALLAGLLLADVPGKGRLLRVVLSRGPVNATVNRLRRRFGVPPLAVPDRATP